MDEAPDHSRRKTGRIALLVTPAAAFIALLTYGVIKAPAAPQIGDAAPSFSAPLLSGKGTSSLSDHRGRPLVLNFWASWCEPCKAEAPLLDEAHDAYGNRVSFLGVDIRDARSDARAFVAEHGIGYPSVRDETRTIYRAYGLTGQPETFLIDSEGVVIEHVAGPLLRREELFTMLDVLVSAMVEPTLPIAFAAGLVSFLSPCVLPLVPGYLSFMSGYGPEQRRGFETAAVAAAFVLGFTLVFVALGASATLLGSLLRSNRELMMRLSGVLIILLGLVFLGVIRIPWLYRERRFHPTPKAGLYGSVVLGAAFAFGWSPCIGVTMGAALTLAASRNTMGEGALLLAIYSLGLGVPFILAGLGVARLAGAVSWLRTHTRALNLAGGALLVGVGLLFLTDRVTELSAWMQRGMTAANLDFWSF